MKKGLLKKIVLFVLGVLTLAVVFAGCELQDPVTEATWYINDNQSNYYNKDHTTGEEAVNEFTDSITALRTYLQGADFVDSGYYMGVNFDIDLRDSEEETVGNFALRVQAFLYTFPYEDEEGNPIYYYYENGKYIPEKDANTPDASRKLISGLEIHNEAIKKSDISIEWYNGATNTVLIGMYFDGLNSNAEDPGNVLYLNVQGYKRSFDGFGDTVLYQQLIRLLVNLSVEGLLEAVGLQGDAGVGSINKTMTGLVGESFKRVVNGDLTSLLFYQISLDTVTKNFNALLYRLLGVFERKWDPMTKKFLGFKFSTVANALITKITADMQSIISPDKTGETNVLTDAVFAFDGKVNSYDVTYDYAANISFDYGWSYPTDLVLDKLYYEPFVHGNYWFDGLLYVPAWDSQFDAVIKTDIQQYDNSTNNVFMEFRDIANGELMIGVYYRDERAWLDITGLSYMYGWIDLPALGFPKVYDEHIDLAEVLGKFFKMIDRTIVAIVDGILDPASSDKKNKALEYIIGNTSYSEKDPNDIFSINSETLRIDLDLVKGLLEETGQGTYSTRQIINILDSLMPYTMDQIAIMLGIVSAEVMLEKTYFTLTWDVDKQQFIIVMATTVGVVRGDPATVLFRLNLDPIFFGQQVTITRVDFSKFKPLRQIYTYSGTLGGDFIFSSQETVDLSKLLSATIGESSGLNTPYRLSNNAGLTFELIYDQFVTDQVADGRLKKAGRSAFTLSVWLTGREETIIIQLSSDDVCFDNEVYKDLPAREDELGYVWVNIACVSKNGVQAIPKVKIREDVFMASMSAYMNNETSIEDDVSSFADNDFNLSLTSIITALCKDAYVIPASTKLEITSSNETLQNLFRVKGLIGNIKVDAGFDYRVKGLDSIRKEYYMYEVGFFENIVGNSPYDTALHDTLEVFFYEDYMDDYDPLKYDFLVYADNVVLDDGSLIAAGTMYIFELGARRTIQMQPIDYASGSPFASDKNASPDNNDISRMRFSYTDLILDPTKEASKDNMLVYESDGRYFYRTYAGKQKQIEEKYIDTGADGTVYIRWEGIREVVFFESESSFYFYDLNRAIMDEDGNQIFLSKKTDRDLLFEYDPESIRISEICLPQYAPRTNGSFMGEVRRYFISFETRDDGYLGKINELHFAYDKDNDYYYDPDTLYPRYYSQADKEYVYREYDSDGKLTFEEARPISLYVMEPCEPLAENVNVDILTRSTTQTKKLAAKFVIDWTLASASKKGYIVDADEGTQVIIAPGMMGEATYPVRIIVTNREIEPLEAPETVSVYVSQNEVADAPVIDEINVDPYEYILEKYKYLSNTDNFNPSYQYNQADMLSAYNRAVDSFTEWYFSQEKFAFTINFKWQQSYLFERAVPTQYIAKVYNNYEAGVLTRYAWYFDANETGSNRELSIEPGGGTIYLHGYFKGQLVALKVNIGRREFSHVKFYRGDTFDPDTYNAGKDRGEVLVNGAYRANYYDSATYEIDATPTFVFTDGVAEYEYVFDMRYISGMTNGALQYVDAYTVKWGNTAITNVTSIGSYTGEYTYSYLYKKGERESAGVLYDALTVDQKSNRVKILMADKSINEDFLYTKDPDSGLAMRLKKWTYEELATVLTESELEGTVFETEYGRKTAEKFYYDRMGDALVRDTDTEGDLTLVNRPFYFYYFTLTEENMSEYMTAEELEIYNYTGTDTETLNKRTALHAKYKLGEVNVHYMTEKEYEMYNYVGDDPDLLAERARVRAKYSFDTGDNGTITTAGVDLYYLLRVYFSLGGDVYAISTLSNEIIQPENLKDQATGVTGFDVLELRIEVDCPQLEVIELTDVTEKDQLTGENFHKSKVDAGAGEKAYGYYLVDPLNASSLILPDSMTIYFRNEGFTSSHTFSGLSWAASFDENNQPVYTYRRGSEDIPLIAFEAGRYVLKLDLNEISEELLFKAMVMIGNEVSGYKKVTVAVKVLSKDPTNVDFYSARTGEKLNTAKTTAEYVTGEGLEESVKKVTYYTYYVNTFANFEIPDRIEATFTDEHKQEYYVEWTPVVGDTAVFAPNTIVTLVTTIGTSEDVEVKIYLVVVVDNLELNRMEVIGEYANYYVTVQKADGEILSKKVRIGDMFRQEGQSVEFYYREGSRYYIRVSTGSREDGDVEATKIGLYTYSSETGRYTRRESLTVYEFIQKVYAKATLYLNKNEVDVREQKIIRTAKPISDYWIKLHNGASESNVPVRNAVEILYQYRPAEANPDVMTVRVGYRDERDYLFTPLLDENGELLIGDNTDGSTRAISYSEFVSIVIREEMAQAYDYWRVIRVNSRENGDLDTEGVPFGTARYLSSFVRFAGTSKTLELKNSAGVDLLGLDGGTVTLRKPDNTEVTMSEQELVYRLTAYYAYQKVAANTQVVVNNKDIGIQNLNKIMNVNDMLIRVGSGIEGTSGDKYVIALGTGKGAYDLTANLRFTGGYILAEGYTGSSQIDVQVYGDNGDATYSNGYVFASAVTATVTAVINDGTGATKDISYNRLATDDKLTEWHVETETTNIRAEVDSMITRISAQDVYATGKGRQISVSTLTAEGFRLLRTIRFETVRSEMSNGFSGGNANAVFADTKTFVISDGLIAIENVYDFVAKTENAKSVDDYFGTIDYLPKTLSVRLNDRQITVTDVEWRLTSGWLTTLSGLTYKGTTGKHVMAMADILGCPDNTESQVTTYYGGTRISILVNIIIESAEVEILPWETSENGNGLATETLATNDGGKEFRVYVDAYADDDALRKGAIVADDIGRRYLNLGTTLLAQYSGGKEFLFYGIRYMYGGTREIKKIYFDGNGMDVAQMISSSGDLTGISASLLNERYLDLTVSLGLGQDLTLRVYFHNKAIDEKEYLIYKTEYYSESGDRMRYVDLTNEQKEATLGDTDEKVFVADASGYAYQQALLYYYVEYFEGGRRMEYTALTSAQRAEKVPGTDVDVYVKESTTAYARKIAFVYSDMLAIVDPKDEDVRAAIRKDLSDDLEQLIKDTTAEANTIRINYDLEGLIETAQALRSVLKKSFEGLRITSSAAAETTTVIRNKLRNAVNSVGKFNDAAFDIDKMSLTKAFTEKQRNDYVLYFIRTISDALTESDEEGVVFDLREIVTGEGTSMNKSNRIANRVETYFTELIEESYNAVIRTYIETEYAKLLIGKAESLTKDEFTNAIYYKNMIEGEFDADAVVTNLFRLRDFRNSGLDVTLAEKQIKLTRTKAAGYGYSIGYTALVRDGQTVLYDRLSTDERDEMVTFGNVRTNKYTHDAVTGLALVAGEEYTYETLVYAVIIEEVLNAIARADARMTNKDENFLAIRETVLKFFMGRLDLGSYCLGGTPFSGTTVQTYSIADFRTSYAYSDNEKVGKKVMRAYLANMINEAMDFTALGDEDWEEFKGVTESLVIYSYHNIEGYEDTINSIRRNLSNGSSVPETIRGLIATGVRNYVNVIYAEARILQTMKDVQTRNGQLVPASAYTEGYSVNAFSDILNEHMAKYFIEPYYSFRSVPNTILVFFKDRYTLDEREYTDRTEDVSGKPYKATIEWSEDGIGKLISYTGGRGYVGGVVKSPVMGTNVAVYLAVYVDDRTIPENEKIITTDYIEDALDYVRNGSDEFGQTTRDGLYLMSKNLFDEQVRFYSFNKGYGLTEANYGNRDGEVRYILQYAIRTDGAVVAKKFSGYDENSVIVYEFINTLDEDNMIVDQAIFVYNPFVFSQAKDLPARIYVDGTLRKIRWGSVAIQPSGNISVDNGQQSISGTIVNEQGQSVDLKLNVAQWGYAGLYRRTNATGSNVMQMSVEGKTQNFVSMDPLQFFFSAQSKYSPEDYFLLAFSLRISMNGKTSRIVFAKSNPLDSYTGVKEANDGFEYKAFYPENSRLLEYETDDDSMAKIDVRSRYVLYWETMKKDQTIGGQLSQVKDCNVYLGNADVKQYSLTSLRDTSGATVPVKATYSCERMSIDSLRFVNLRHTVEETTYMDGAAEENGYVIVCEETGTEYLLGRGYTKFLCEHCGQWQSTSSPAANVVQMHCNSAECEHNHVNATIRYNTVTGEITCDNDACVLFDEIKDSLLAKTGQAAVVIAPDRYFPTTGDFLLRENNVHYNKDELTVRFLWNGGYEQVVRKLKDFVAYAYKNVEDSAREAFVLNLLMTWNKKTDAEREEIVQLAMEYMRRENEQLGDEYSEEDCRNDAYALLAINERYNYNANRNRLRGGGDNNVIVTVLMNVADSPAAVFVGTFTVKVLFADYTPLAYYQLRNNRYTEIGNSLSESEHVTTTASGEDIFRLDNLLIAIRKEYWLNDTDAYDSDGRDMMSPYDEIGTDMIKLLQIFSDGNRVDGNGTARKGYTERDYLVEVTDIVWEYDREKRKATSRSFKINGITYISDLLTLTLIAD